MAADASDEAARPEEPVGLTWEVDVDEDGARHLRGELFVTATEEQRAVFARIEAFAMHAIAAFYERGRRIKIADPDPRAGLN